jgi:repressor LexA
MDNEHRVTSRERVYSLLVDYIMENGYAPSVKEICMGTGLSSTSSVYAHLLKLEDEGKIQMKHKATRAIKVTGF